jgi:hypothetical protein
MARRQKPETEFLHVAGVSCVQTVFSSLTPFLGLPIATVLRQKSRPKIYSSTNPNLSGRICKYLIRKNAAIGFRPMAAQIIKMNIQY